MQVKQLYADRFVILGTVEGGICDAEKFLAEGEQTTAGSRDGLKAMLSYVASHGLHEAPSAWSHEADKRLKVLEFIKGDLRLFFFKGEGNQIAVCTGGVLKKGQGADKKAVAKTAKLRAEFLAATAQHTLEVIKDDHK